METKNTIQITSTSDNQFVSDIIQIIRNGKDKAYAAVNASMMISNCNTRNFFLLQLHLIFLDRCLYHLTHLYGYEDPIDAIMSQTYCTCLSNYFKLTIFTKII